MKWPAVVFADVVNRADIRVVERRSRAGLPMESFQGLAVGGNVVRKELQGYVSAEPGVFGLVDDAHTTAAQLFEDTVVGESLADHETRTPL